MQIQVSHGVKQNNMKYKIEKEDKFLCIKKFVMTYPKVKEYIKDVIQTSEINNCITDNSLDKKHFMDNQKDFFQYFKLVI